MAQFGSTSFIPKKPAAAGSPRRRGGVINIFFLVSLIVFLAATAASVGVFLLERITVQRLDEKKIQLDRAREAFEPALIEELALLDIRLKSAREILDSHVAVSAFFSLLEQSTLKSVQFDTFTYQQSAEGGKIEVKMSGRGLSFGSVALQSDVFGKDPFIRDSIFANLDLDDAGNVTFDLTASVDPALISYRRLTEGLTRQ